MTKEKQELHFLKAEPLVEQQSTSFIHMIITDETLAVNSNCCK